METPTFIWPALFAIATISVSVWMYRFKPAIQPPIPSKQPMIAFEFATTAHDIRALFIDSKTGKPATAYVEKMRSLNLIDFLFISCYTAFSFSFAQQAYQAYPSFWGRVAMIVSVIPGLFDVLENSQLLRILNRVKQEEATDYEPELTRLSIATWIKWIGISWLMVLLLPFFWHNGWPSKGMALMAIMVAIAGLSALLNRRRKPIPTTYVTFLFAASALLYFYAVVKCIVLHVAPTASWL